VGADRAVRAVVDLLARQGLTTSAGHRRLDWTIWMRVLAYLD